MRNPSRTAALGTLTLLVTLTACTPGTPGKVVAKHKTPGCYQITLATEWGGTQTACLPKDAWSDLHEGDIYQVEEV